MSCTAVPTLVEMTAMEVALYLHNDKEISRRSSVVLCKDSAEERRAFMAGKISKLSLPDVLQERILELASNECLFMAQIQAVHRSISAFLGRQCHCLDGVLKSSLVRSPEDSFDEEGSVQRLIRDERIDVEFRFILAGEFWVGDYIYSLYGRLSEQLIQDSRLAKYYIVYEILYFDRNFTRGDTFGELKRQHLQDKKPQLANLLLIFACC